MLAILVLKVNVVDGVILATYNDNYGKLEIITKSGA
jgi:hypothetical protein